jgi:hypothetical protein
LNYKDDYKNDLNYNEIIRGVTSYEKKDIDIDLDKNIFNSDFKT